MDIMTMPKFDNWTTITIKPVNILMIFGYKLKIIYMFVDHYHWIITIMIWQWHCDVPNLAVGYLTHIWNVRTPAATMVCVDFYTHMPVCKHFLYIYTYAHRYVCFHWTFFRFCEIWSQWLNELFLKQAPWTTLRFV